MGHLFYLDKCFNIGQGRVSTECKSGFRLRFPNMRRSCTAKVYAYCIADKNKKMLVWYLTIVVF